MRSSGGSGRRSVVVGDTVHGEGTHVGSVDGRCAVDSAPGGGIRAVGAGDDDRLGTGWAAAAAGVGAAWGRAGARDAVVATGAGGAGGTDATSSSSRCRGRGRACCGLWGWHAGSATAGARSGAEGGRGAVAEVGGEAGGGREGGIGVGVRVGVEMGMRRRGKVVEGMLLLLLLLLVVLVVGMVRMNVGLGLEGVVRREGRRAGGGWCSGGGVVLVVGVGGDVEDGMGWTKRIVESGLCVYRRVGRALVGRLVIWVSDESDELVGEVHRGVDVRELAEWVGYEGKEVVLRRRGRREVEAFLSDLWLVEGHLGWVGLGATEREGGLYHTGVRGPLTASVPSRDPAIHGPGGPAEGEHSAPAYDKDTRCQFYHLTLVGPATYVLAPILQQNPHPTTHSTPDPSKNI